MPASGLKRTMSPGLNSWFIWYNSLSMPRLKATIMERFEKSMVVSESHTHAGTPCWDWISRFNGVDGYGLAKCNRKNILAHRLSYELHIGPIPEGMCLDHLCRNRKCVNPDHLEPVTLKENIKRGWAARPRVTHCKYGHPYAGDNLRITPHGKRVCRACQREAVRKAYYKDLERSRKYHREWNASHLIRPLRSVIIADKAPFV